MKNTIYTINPELGIIYVGNANKPYYYYDYDIQIGTIEHIHYPTGIVPYICYSVNQIGKTKCGKIVYKAYFTEIHGADEITRIFVKDA